MDSSSNSQRCRHQLCFRSLSDAGRALCFPCDGRGCVDIDALNAPTRLSYLYARAVIGREFLLPTVALAALA